MARGITEFRVTLDPVLESRDRIIIADLIINTIQSRTRDGKDIDNNNFTPYNRDYLENLRDDGISKQTPNLDITGDMLEGIELLEEGRGFLVIGIARENRLARLKAGWQQGGNPKIPARRFMGIPNSTIEELQAYIIQATPELSDDNLLAAQIRQEFELTDSILQELEFGNPLVGPITEGFEGL